MSRFSTGITMAYVRMAITKAYECAERHSLEPHELQFEAIWLTCLGAGEVFSRHIVL